MEPNEMLGVNLPNRKWWSLLEAVKQREELRSRGERLVVTNGCFDLLHTGHLYYLQEAAHLGEALWVLLNSDESVRLLGKRAGRPFQSERERAYALAALAVVDGVVLFQTERLTREIEALRPDVYVKGGDYSLDTIDRKERTALESVGADIRFLPLLDGYSTSGLVAKIQPTE
jgi:rfaE bifunctional protein nucleotidyltransferase chain/domain